MLADRIEAPWIDVFEAVLRLCQATPSLPFCLLGDSEACVPHGLGAAAAYAVSHAGWATNPRARDVALARDGQRDASGTELRAFAGRLTEAPFDIPVRGCTIALDGDPVVVEGRLA